MTTLAVGQIWQSRNYDGPGNRYCISHFIARPEPSTIVMAFAFLVDENGNGNHYDTIYFSATTASHAVHETLERGWILTGTKKLKNRIDKIIPDMPLDPSLHVLHAGYIQDRQRKKYKP